MPVGKDWLWLILDRVDSFLVRVVLSFRRREVGRESEEGVGVPGSPSSGKSGQYSSVGVEGLGDNLTGVLNSLLKLRVRTEPRTGILLLLEAVSLGTETGA